MINYNIFKKIIDKVASNNWNKKIKRINQEYDKIFYIENEIYCYITCGCYTGENCNEILHLRFRNTIFEDSLTIHKKCGYPKGMDISINIPKRYHYTSGMDNPKGYKKNEK